MRRKAYSGRNQIFSVNGAPMRGLADGDDAIVAEMTEDTFLDPAIDLSGDGTHVENGNESGMVTVRFKIGATVALGVLEGLREAKAPIPAIGLKDLGSADAGFIGKDCVISRAPTMQRGKNPTDIEYVFKCIKLKIKQGGPIILPI